MSDYVKDQGRVGQSTYWMYYVGIMVLTWAMYGWGLYEFLKFHLMPIVFGFIAPFILSIYFRIIAMRRCRDIGWPAFLPWLTLGLTMGCGVIGGLLVGFHPGSAHGTISALMGVSMLLGLVDFVFLIAIGCIGSAGGGSDSFADEHFDRRDLPRDSRGYVDSLESVASGRRARPMPKAFGEDDAPFAAAEPSGVTRPATSFGRRVM